MGEIVANPGAIKELSDQIWTLLPSSPNKFQVTDTNPHIAEKSCFLYILEAASMYIGLGTDASEKVFCNCLANTHQVVFVPKGITYQKVDGTGRMYVLEIN